MMRHRLASQSNRFFDMSSETLSGGPLSGLRVIELGAFIAGPYCGQLLADFGADVIKVEPPGEGDPLRRWGVNRQGGRSLWWSVLGRNKQCITLDLRKAEGQALARRLILGADVLVENFRPGTLESWHLDPDGLRVENPGLIVTRISGFGQTGPYRERAGFAAVAEAMAGLRVLTGYPDRPPTRTGLSIGDSLAGVFAALGTVCALHAREVGGRRRAGQTVDTAITESVLAVLESVIAEFSATGHTRLRSGTALPGIAPSNIYATEDSSWVIIAANSDGLFRKLAIAMGQAALADQPCFATHEARGLHQAELDDIIGRWSSTLPLAEILRMLVDAGVPVAPVQDAAGVARDPHFRDRAAVIDVDTPEDGRLAMQGIVPKLSATPGSIRWAGPPVGAHNSAIYEGILGLSRAEVCRLQAQGII